MYIYIPYYINIYKLYKPHRQNIERDLPFIVHTGDVKILGCFKGLPDPMYPGTHK